MTLFHLGRKSGLYVFKEWTSLAKNFMYFRGEKEEIGKVNTLFSLAGRAPISYPYSISFSRFNLKISGKNSDWLASVMHPSQW